MIRRDAEKTLKELAKHYPVVALTGPRQAGKSTLAKQVFPDKAYCLLEDMDTRQFAEEDPRGFLAQFPDGAILDEIQNCPNLFSYLQGIVDEKKQMCLFVLTGSHQFSLNEKISQSLAGRVGYIHLLPFTLHEITSAGIQIDIEQLLYQGCYPPIYDRHIPATNWYLNYIDTYLHKDVRTLLDIKDLRSFHRFLKMCAARSGQLLNLSSLANDCGISHHTAKSWLSVLEASFIIFTLEPHHENYNKRLVKSPKIYFYDTGLVCALLGIEKPEQLVSHAQRGAIFETWVISEMLKNRFNQGLASNLFFWRDNTGNEVDIIIDNAGELTPVEIKSGKTITKDYFKGLKKWLVFSKKNNQCGYIVYAGDANQTRENIKILSWKSLENPDFIES